MDYVAPFGSLDPDAPYVDRNTPGATTGSKVPAKAIENPMRELVGLIEMAGIDPDDSDLTQVAKAIQSGATNYAVAAGTANTLTATFNPVPDALPDGMEITVLISTKNTGAATLNGDAIQNNNGGALIGGELVAGNLAKLTRRGSAWRLDGISKGRLIATQVFKTAGTQTYTPTPGTLYVDVEVQGGGGASGGNPATGASQLSISGGGGSGAWAQKLIASGFAGVTVTVGAGGTGVSGASGGNGGASSFGGLVSANGGNGGGSAGPGSNTQNFNTSGGAGGAVGASGDVNSAGVPGASILMVSAVGTGGTVAPSRFAGGPGAGGQGSSSPASTSAQVGQPGQPGIVIVREYA